MKGLVLGTFMISKLNRLASKGRLLRILAFIYSLICPCRGFPSSSAGKESTYSTRDLGLIPGLGRSPREGNGYPLQYFGLKNSMD